MASEPPAPARVARLVGEAGLALIADHRLEARAARYEPVPAGVHPRLRARLEADWGGKVYAHQAGAIASFARGEDVCLATPTASGKSLAFMSAAVHVALSEPDARCIAVYPVKALIRDQLKKWQAFLSPFGLEVGFVDGSVRMEDRAAILDRCHVLAMTPDVMHAWVMSHLNDRAVAGLLRRLRLLVLDEAHVYDGVFGTNMAYFLRRLRAVAAEHRLLCSTATIGAPGEFMRKLTGRQMTVLDGAADGSAGHEKTLLLARPGDQNGFEASVKLLVSLSQESHGRFLAFCDSRKAVERFVAAAHRHGRAETIESDDEPQADTPEGPDGAARILPYRAGYEEEDRGAIHEALERGDLRGVVSTSALELGLDIGDIDVVVLMNTPPSVKAFAQRIGRAGRRRPSTCVLIDDQARVSSLAEYVARPPEPSWIYLENRYIQYAQALCAATELQARGRTSGWERHWEGIPEQFLGFVHNELTPSHGVDDDLFALKQLGQETPHYEFPLRNAAEPNFTVEGAFGAKLGTLPYAQVLREAYPGAMYYYMARPNRVVRVEHRKREIRTARGRYITTKPTTQTAVFADFRGGMLSARRSRHGFIAELQLQVSERVVGFTELRGQKRTMHEYGPGSQYSQKALTRFFRTTGVCWSFPGTVQRSEALAERILDAFCALCGIQDRDVGYGLFRANEGPFGSGPVQGMAVYDATFGSLRLTQLLLDRFDEVVAQALSDASEDPPLAREVRLLQIAYLETQPAAAATTPLAPPASDEWVTVIADGERAIYLSAGEGPVDVKVRTHRYTPQGLLYELDHPTTRWMVAAKAVQAIDGTRQLQVNLVTGEEHLWE